MAWNNSTIQASQNISNNTYSSDDYGQENIAVKVTKFILYAFVFVVGFGGNSIVIWMTICKKKVTRTFHNLLLCNLAIADISLLAINLPFRLAYQENNYVWPFESVLCRIIPSFMYLFLTLSSLTLITLSLERCRKINSSTVTKDTVTNFHILLVSLLWVASSVVTLPLFIFLTVVHRNGNPVCSDIWPSKIFEKAYFTVLFVVEFFIPTIVMIFVYANVGIILRRSHGKLRKLGLFKKKNKHRKVRMLECIRENLSVAWKFQDRCKKSMSDDHACCHAYFDMHFFIL